MSEEIAKYQLFDFKENEDFLLYNLAGEEATTNNILNHWHEELEIAYYFHGKAYHHVNGERLRGEDGRVIVTNSGYVHNVITDSRDEDTHVLVIILRQEFVKNNFPEYLEYCFENRSHVATNRMRELFGEIYAFSISEQTRFSHLKGSGLLLELLKELAEAYAQKRDQVDDINVLKNIERIKGVISYIEDNYRETIHQTEVAEKFYFSAGYFSRYFKKCTGMTFLEYLTNFRLAKAKEALIHTELSVSRVAEECGFSDDRRLIIAFKKKFGTTPLQYRKMVKNTR